MATPEEEALARQIMDTVAALLDGVLRSDADAVAAVLAPDSLIEVGHALFGMDALAVPLGLANRPHAMGMTSVQASADMAIAEVCGRDEDDRDLSVSSVFLSQIEGGWRVADIWPVPAEYDLDLESIPEPTVLFYSGQLQLSLSPDAELDEVEAALVPSLQGDGIGLHLVERAVHLWRIFQAAEGQVGGTPAAWAAALHFAVLAMEGQEPNPDLLAAKYKVLAETVLERFMTLVGRMGGTGEDMGTPPPAPPPAASSGLVDLSGRPLGANRPGDPRQPRGGIILPGG